MTGSFRFIPPEPRPDALARPRLLRELVGRWRHAVTTVVGGAGLGKTTLLAQAVTENHMAPRGDDVWVGVEAHDSDLERFARVVAAAVARSRPGPAGPGAAPDDPPPTPV
jgi:LuxR family transcriptional regulator, maltose regulon positive regulatory protein